MSWLTRLLPLLLLAPLVAGAPGQKDSPFRLALERAQGALEAGDLERAQLLIQRA